MPRLGLRPAERPGRPGGLPALAGDPPDPARLPSGCAFHPRCPESTAHCTINAPVLTSGAAEGDGTGPAAGRGPHLAACHYAWHCSGADGRVP